MPTETTKPSRCCLSPTGILAPLVMPPKKKRGCLWHLIEGGRSREIQNVSGRQNLSDLERPRQEVACCGATKVEQRGCNHRARKELTSSAAVVCHTLNKLPKQKITQFPPQVKQHMRAHPVGMGWYLYPRQTVFCFLFLFKEEVHFFYPGPALSSQSKSFTGW